MNEQPKDIRADFQPIDLRKFVDPLKTLQGDARAEVDLTRRSEERRVGKEC